VVVSVGGGGAVEREGRRRRRRRGRNILLFPYCCFLFLFTWVFGAIVFLFVVKHRFDVYSSLGV